MASLLKLIGTLEISAESGRAGVVAGSRCLLNTAQRALEKMGSAFFILKEIMRGITFFDAFNAGNQLTKLCRMQNSITTVNDQAVRRERSVA
jgi:hypothetical protein